MKTFLFGVLLFLVFGIGGYFLYTRYYHQLFPSSSQNVPQQNNQPLIYYSEGNNLYRLNPEVYTENPNDIPNLRLQSTGKIQSLQVDSQNSQFFYDVISPSGNREIWKVSLKDNSSEKLFSDSTSGLENVQKFRDPKLSSDAKKLAFLATHDSEDYLFSWDIEKQSLSNLLYGKFSGTISDFTWDSKGNIAFAAKENGKTVIKLFDGKSVTSFALRQNPITGISTAKDGFIITEELSENNKKTTNLFSLLKVSKKETPLSDLTYPKTVKNFSVSLDGKSIVFEVEDQQTKKGDIYAIEADGTNLLQLTNDGKSEEPVFSPDGKKIAFKNDGASVFTLNLSAREKQKLLNGKIAIDKLLIWR